MAYTYVSGTFNGSATKTGFVISAGQSLIICAADLSGSGSTLTMADGTNTYVVRGSTNDTRNGCTFTLIDCLAPTPGTYTLTMSGAVTIPVFTIFVYTGLSSFSAGSYAGFFSGASPPTTTDGCATAAITPTSYPAALVSIGTVGGTFTPGTGFVQNFSASSGPTFYEEDLRLLAGSNIASWTMTAGGADVVVLGAAYLETTFVAANVAPYTRTTWFVTDTVIQQ